MTPYKAIVFDLDGTLIHSAPDIHAGANAALADLGRDPLDLPTIISFIGAGVETLVERCLRATGAFTPELHARALALVMTHYTQNMTTLTEPYPGVRAALDQFRAAGIRLGVCTNKVDGPAKEICRALDLSEYFDEIVGARADVAKKPDPASLFNCVQAMGADPRETLYVGDSEIDYLTAKNASISFRLFARGYLNAPLPDLAQDDRFDDWADHGITLT